MESSFSPIDGYWQYLESIGLNRDSSELSLVATSIEGTCWDNPTSALELNNFAVLALIEAEQCEESYLRGLSLEMALEALNNGVELGEHPLCIAHLALLQTMTGEMELGMHGVFSALLNTLQPAYVNEQTIPPGIVYLPPANSGKDSRCEQLAQILPAEDGYTQALLLLSEVLCRSQLVFYNQTGLRFLHLAAQISPSSAAINLKLGISSLVNHQWEGILYLHRARELAPDSAAIMQTLYLAYRDLGQMHTANSWMEMARSLSQGNLSNLDGKWTELASDSSITYIPFEEQLSLVVEPSFRSLVTSVLLAEGDWFEKEMEFWRSWIKPGMTVIDVGANVGVYTFSAALRVGSEGCVLAVEPFSGCVRCLQETCRINQLDWVKVCAGAASDRNGIVKLGLHGANELNEIIGGDAQITNPGIPVEKVDCFSLDSLVEQENISQVDFLKIDAEGHELQVLAGSNKLIKRYSPIILYENIAGSKGSNLAVANFLQSIGYQLFRYQPYLQQLIPITSIEDLQGKLNLIALPKEKDSALGYQLDSVESRESPQPQATSVPTANVAYSYAPIDVFHSYHYQRHNQRRQEHLASLGLDIAGATVLEVGAGIGDHTSFFLDRGCQVFTTEARQANLEILRSRYPNLQVRHLDLDAPDTTFNEVFDIVYCYGLLYHLKQPTEAIEFMSRCCRKMLLLETCVSFGEGESINPCGELAASPSQAISGQGCRPTRRWVYNQLKGQFDFVYMPITQPNHEEFPVDWSLPASTKILTRSIYIASREALDNQLLLEDIPRKQQRH